MQKLPSVSGMHHDVEASYEPLPGVAEGTVERCQSLLPFWALELFDAEMLCNAAECVHLCMTECNSVLI
jgi:hypothetical protein